MMDILKGRYWDKPWSLVDGCTPCSPGCNRCWSAGMAHRFGEYTIKVDNNPPQFMGVIQTHPERLGIPLSRKNNTVFAVWNDLFHEDVPDQFIYGATRVMKGRPWHTFLLLTKRPAKMLRLSNLYDELPNVWSGLTVCNQQEADEKIPVFLQVQGKKYLSLEPLLDPINFRWMIAPRRDSMTDHLEVLKSINAVILGGETGPGSRLMYMAWAQSIRDQCMAANVPFFFKSWGDSARGGMKKEEWLKVYRLLDGRTHDDLPWISKP